MSNEPAMNEATPLVVIFGMHRSGTSYVAQVLNSAGFNLGDDVLRDGESDNLCGHWESQSVIQINDGILDVSGGSWCKPPSRLLSAVTTGVSIDRFVSWMNRRRPAAFKDPRLTLTFPLWRERLGHYQLIACLRHPMAVARSLQVRQGWPIARGLNLWVDYNRRLLDCLQHEPNALLFDFDADSAWIEGWFEKCFEQLGTETEISALQTWNPLLRHHHAAEAISDPIARKLYEQLKALCDQQSVLAGARATRLPQTETSSECVKIDNALVLPSVPTSDLVSDLAEVYRRHNLVIQQIDQRLHSAEAEHSRSIGQQKSDLRELEQWTHECYERLATELANEHSRSTTAFAALNRIAADHETIVDRIAYLNLRCDENHRMFITKFDEFTHLLHEFSENLTTCNQAFTEINNWMPLKVWRGLRKKWNAIRARLRRKSPPPTPQGHPTPAPHWRERESAAEKQETSQRAK